MKWLLTVVAMTRDTRRRAGKSWVEVVDTDSDSAFGIELRFERQYAIDHPKQTCKVVDVRQAEGKPLETAPRVEETLRMNQRCPRCGGPMTLLRVTDDTGTSAALACGPCSRIEDLTAPVQPSDTPSGAR